MRDRTIRPGRHNVALAAVVLATAALSSCGSSDAFFIARANRLFRDGFAHEAAALYLRAGAGEEPIASYDLANVFASLGEDAAARAMHDRAMESGDAVVVARSWYNIGAGAYARGEYAEAAAAFRSALEVRARSEAELGGRASGPDVALSLEMARAYELALKAQAERRDAGATERSPYGAGRPDGSVQPFALSRTDEKTLFAPGSSDRGAAEDH
ncbi:MAG: hypothetical protein CVV47_07360 [Spirochaetae bacterium HGW-Spirochaetae-3]|jgi:tetratricopeptide (TPR) repeat protein|nr:MAG: hypothetical protein CVV47_07360 [Spirochaetae bacterium HGW-Spirochaetae-3]